MIRKICALVFAFATVALAQEATLQELDAPAASHKGDVDEMQKHRAIRALVAFNKTAYFIDNGRPRGLTYEALTEFERFVNTSLHPNDKSGKEKIHILLIPADPDTIASDLQNGRADIIAAPVFITEERKKAFDFISVGGSRKDVVVSGASALPLTSLDDLSGREVYQLRAGLAWTELEGLNKKLTASGKPAINLKPADKSLEWEDLVEMASVGIVQYVVVPLHIAQLWKNVFPDLKIYADFPVVDKLETGWVVRKDSPKLRAMLEQFATTHRIGTSFGNTIYNRYAKNPQFIKNNRSAEGVQRFQKMAVLFKKYGDQYNFPWMLVAAEAFQESGLDHSVKSRVGAVGVMQVMPATAAGPPVSIPSIDKLENNIQAGVKLLKYIRDDYFKDDPMDPINKTLMTLAAYNAGPARIRQCRKEAAAIGLNPNLWFKNVEYAVAKKVGAETVNYVSNIYKYYLGYKLQTERTDARATNKKI